MCDTMLMISHDGLKVEHGQVQGLITGVLDCETLNTRMLDNESAKCLTAEYGVSENHF